MEAEDNGRGEERCYTYWLGDEEPKLSGPALGQPGEGLSAGGGLQGEASAGSGCHFSPAQPWPEFD